MGLLAKITAGAGFNNIELSSVGTRAQQDRAAQLHEILAELCKKQGSPDPYTAALRSCLEHEMGAYRVLPQGTVEREYLGETIRGLQQMMPPTGDLFGLRYNDPHHNVLYGEHWGYCPSGERVIGRFTLPIGNAVGTPAARKLDGGSSVIYSADQIILQIGIVCGIPKPDYPKEDEVRVNAKLVLRDMCYVVYGVETGVRAVLDEDRLAYLKEDLEDLSSLVSDKLENWLLSNTEIGARVHLYNKQAIASNAGGQAFEVATG